MQTFIYKAEFHGCDVVVYSHFFHYYGFFYKSPRGHCNADNAQEGEDKQERGYQQVYLTA
jgi:hypothetical protein